jgi:ribosomal protein S27E
MEKKTRRIKCPDCLNIVTVTIDESGELKGFCRKCNAVIMGKQPSAKEKLIRIVKP